MEIKQPRFLQAYMLLPLLLVFTLGALYSSKGQWDKRTIHIDSMKKYVGRVEKGDNRGPYVDKWNKFVGAPLGSSYCASSASYFLHLNPHVEPLLKSALARNLYAKAPSYSRVPIKEVLLGRVIPKKGWIVVWGQRNKITGHAGFIYQDWIGAEGWTIEANTSMGNKGSQRNGEYVAIKYRKIDPFAALGIIGFVKIDLKGNHVK